MFFTWKQPHLCLLIYVTNGPHHMARFPEPSAWWCTLPRYSCQGAAQWVHLHSSQKDATWTDTRYWCRSYNQVLVRYVHYTSESCYQDNMLAISRINSTESRWKNCTAIWLKHFVVQLLHKSQTDGLRSFAMGSCSHTRCLWQFAWLRHKPNRAEWDSPDP